MIIASGLRKELAVKIAFNNLRKLLPRDSWNKIVIGLAGDKRINSLIHKKVLSLKEKKESFLIKKVKGYLVLTGFDIRGIVYGMYWLIDRLKSGYNIDSFLDIYRSPGITQRIAECCAPLYHHKKPIGEYAMFGWLRNMDTDNPPYLDKEEMEKAVKRFKKFCQILLQLGFNGLTIGEPLHLITLEKDIIYRKDEKKLKIRAQHYREYFKEMLGYANSMHLDVYIYSDEYSYTTAMERAIGKLCYFNPRFWYIYEKKYEELFGYFPYVKGVMIRTGETRNCDLYRGVGIHGWGKAKNFMSKPICCSKCEKMTVAEHYRFFIRKSLALIRDKFSKELIFRTWVTCSKLLHSDPKKYHQVFTPLSTNELRVSIKETETDFWFYNQINPTIGIGKQKQLVEIDCRRDYEGGGLFPCCTEDRLAKVFRYIEDEGVYGIWVWPSESGVAEPSKLGKTPSLFTYFKGFTKWIEANVYLCGRLSWNPKEDTRKILKDWSHQEFGKDASPLIEKILDNSEEAITKAFYIKDYASHRDHTLLPGWPVRQLKIYFKVWKYDGDWDDEKKRYNFPYNEMSYEEKPVLLEKIYKYCKGNIERNIKEGYEALKIAEGMLAISKKLKNKIDMRNYRQIRYSLLHSISLYRLLATYRDAFLSYYYLKDNYSPNLNKQLSHTFSNFKEALSFYIKDYDIYHTSELWDFIRTVEKERQNEKSN
ncbi:MAG: hypothetical protein KAX20_06635 [Candidatus Omnitrophica bacterium]|nr:hypothetical protein [Candidatus Omnitrophota bacterium]